MKIGKITLVLTCCGMLFAPDCLLPVFLNCSGYRKWIFASPESTFNKFGLVYPLSLLVGIATIDCNGKVKYYVLADFTLVSVFDQATDVKMLLFHVIWFW